MTDLVPHPLRQLVAHVASRRPQRAPEWLTAAEASLFGRMPPADQYEGLAVAETLRNWGYGADRDLLAAAVLHDVGKSEASPNVTYRVLMTLLEGLGPAAIQVMCRHSQALRILSDHAARGARLAAAAGLPADLQRLIREHHAPATDDRSAALQRADALH